MWLRQPADLLLVRLLRRVVHRHHPEPGGLGGLNGVEGVLKHHRVLLVGLKAAHGPLVDLGALLFADAHLRHGDEAPEVVIDPRVAEVGAGKRESAEIYERAMRRLQSNKKDTVVFEDAYHAIVTAKAAGFRVAAVYDASEEANQPAIRKLADYYIRSFEEMFEPTALE